MGLSVQGVSHCLGAVGSATPTMQCLTACGQWAMELLLCTAMLPEGSGLWNSCNALPHCLGVVGTGTPVMHRHIAWGQWAMQLLHMHCHTAQGQWAVELLLCTATLSRVSWLWNFRLGAVGGRTPVLHCHTA